MIFISTTTVYPFHLHTDMLPYPGPGGSRLTISFYQGYAAMFWGKIPSNTIGKKYALVKEEDTQRILSIDEWPPEAKVYFEKEEGKYKVPFRIRFGWIYIIAGTFLFLVMLFVLLIAYLMLITKK